MLLTKWCLDDTEPAPGESYDEEGALAPPIKEGSNAVSDALADGNDPDVNFESIPETAIDLAAEGDFVFTEDDVPAVTAPQVMFAHTFLAR